MTEFVTDYFFSIWFVHVWVVLINCSNRYSADKQQSGSVIGLTEVSNDKSQKN